MAGGQEAERFSDESPESSSCRKSPRIRRWLINSSPSGPASELFAPMMPTSFEPGSKTEAGWAEEMRRLRGETISTYFSDSSRFRTPRMTVRLVSNSSAMSRSLGSAFSRG